MKESLFLLLRYAVCENAEPDKSEIEKNLPQIYSLAKRHDMAQTVAYACERLGITNAELSKESALSVFVTERIIYTAQCVGEILEDAKIPHIFLKGYYMRSLYPEKRLRPSCDVDVFVDESNLEKATEVLEKAGFVKGRRHIYDVTFTSPNSSTVELHFMLTDGDKNKRVAEVLANVWDYTEQETEYRFKMTDEMFYFYHVNHMAKHVRYGGCGIRPFLDMWLLCKNLDDRTKTDALLEKGGLLIFEKYARQLSEIWFSGEEHDSDSRNFEEYVLSGAVYGNNQNAAAVKGGRSAYLLGRIFMPYSQLKHKYPALNGRPWLMPIFTVVRWCNLLKGKKAQRTIRELRSSSKVSRQDSRKFSQMIKKFKI